MRNVLKTTQGFILMTSYLMMTVLSIFSLAMFSRSYFFLQATERNQNRILAFNQAETGIDFAMTQLAINPAYGGTAQPTVFGVKGAYAVQVCPPACEDEALTPAGVNIRLISATGYAPTSDNTSRAYAARAVQAYVRIEDIGFDYAAYGKTGVQINGNPNVDSYSSGAGDYNAGGNIGAQGDIASDATVELIGNATINGDIFATDLEVAGNATYSGSLSKETPDLDCEPGETEIPSSGSLNLSGDEQKVLEAGTYHFDSIQVSGNAQIIVQTGPVVIYVDGTADFSGNGIVNATNTPTNLIIIATSNADIKIVGNGAFHGAVLAPASDVSVVGNGDFYGAIIGKTFHQTGEGNLHYDTDLSAYNYACNNVKLLSWQEKGTLLTTTQ